MSRTPVYRSPSDLTNPLDPRVLVTAYRNGFFPMPHPETGEILWFKPDPRAIIPLEHFHCSRSLAKRLRRQEFACRINTSFGAVMTACASRTETWITPAFVEAYTAMHDLGFAFSVEAWRQDSLVGGLYGVSFGGAFFAESMFSHATDASKAALYYLVQQMQQKGMTLLEVQFMTPHLASLGAIEISAMEYEQRLRDALQQKIRFVS